MPHLWMSNIIYMTAVSLNIPLLPAMQCRGNRIFFLLADSKAWIFDPAPLGEPMKTAILKRWKPLPEASFVRAVLRQQSGPSLIFIAPDLLRHRVSLEGSSHDRKTSSPPAISHPGERTRPADETALSRIAWRDSVRADGKKKKKKGRCSPRAASARIKWTLACFLESGGGGLFCSRRSGPQAPSFLMSETNKPSDIIARCFCSGGKGQGAS